MSLLSASTISALGNVVAQAMPDSYEVMRPGPDVDDGFGHETPGADVVASRGSCLLKGIASHSAEAEIAGRLSLTKPAIIDMPVGVDVKESDRLRINGTRSFEVSLVIETGRWAVKTTAIVEEKA